MDFTYVSLRFSPLASEWGHRHLFVLSFLKVRCASRDLVEKTGTSVKEFVENLRDNQTQAGAVSLEFFQRRKGGFAFYKTPLIWEVWTLKVDCSSNSSKDHLEESLLEKLMAIVQAINSSRCYLPQTPVEQQLDTVFDTSFQDVQPYLHRVSWPWVSKILLTCYFN